MPKVQVILPCYNAERYLARTLEAAMAQTFRDFEILLVDDGSTDGSRAIAERFAVEHPGKLRYLHQENQGHVVARNRALETADAELIAMLDADDVWRPEHLARSVELLDARPEIGLTHAEVINIDAEDRELGRPQRERRYLSGRLFRYLYTRRGHIACTTVVFRREALAKSGLFDPNLARLGNSDRDLWLRISQHCEIAYIEEPTAYYRVHPGNFSANPEKMYKGRMYVIEKYAGTPHVDALLKRHALAGLYKQMGDQHMEAGERREAVRMFQRAAWTYPLRPYFVLLALKKTFLS